VIEILGVHVLPAINGIGGFQILLKNTIDRIRAEGYHIVSVSPIADKNHLSAVIAYGQLVKTASSVVKA
jgi:hypothetical protein